jgi:hypothetical protein
LFDGLAGHLLGEFASLYSHGDDKLLVKEHQIILIKSLLNLNLATSNYTTTCTDTSNITAFDVLQQFLGVNNNVSVATRSTKSTVILNTVSTHENMENQNRFRVMAEKNLKHLGVNDDKTNEKNDDNISKKTPVRFCYCNFPGCKNCREANGTLHCRSISVLAGIHRTIDNPVVDRNKTLKYHAIHAYLQRECLRPFGKDINDESKD